MLSDSRPLTFKTVKFYFTGACASAPDKSDRHPLSYPAALLYEYDIVYVKNGQVIELYGGPAGTGREYTLQGLAHHAMYETRTARRTASYRRFDVQQQ